MTTEQVNATTIAFALSGGKLDELELLAGGLYSPADGYCLPAEVPAHWPAPFVLEVPSVTGHHALEYGTLTLTDPDGTGLAELRVDQIQESTKQESVFLAGKLTDLRSAEHPPARHLRLTRPFADGSAPHRAIVAAVFSQTPRPWELAAAMAASSDAGAELSLIAACGPQPHGRYTVSPLLRELESTAAHIHGAQVRLLVFPMKVGAPTPRDRMLQEHVLAHLGAIKVLDYSIQGKASNDESALARGVGSPGTVIFLTGLSGSGKSTVARALAESIHLDTGLPATLLDGDDVRRILSPGLGFSKEEREANIARIGWVAALVSAAGGLAICAPIAPFDAGRRQVRHMAEKSGKFLLVHISTPLAECESRDRKGLYAKARRGEIKDFTGIDSPYEHPDDADLHLDTSLMTVAEAVHRIRQRLAAM